MSEKIGQQLRQAREARALSLEQVSRATHIRPHYLQALEAGDFRALPSKAQARGFLRAYAGYLGLNAEALLASVETPAAETAPGGSSPGSAPPGALPTGGGPTSEPAHGAAASGAAVSGALPAQPAPGSPASAAGTHPPAASNAEIPDEIKAIFQEVGQKLQHQRELLGLSLDDVERHTRLRTFYLRALEDGDLANLPSPVQGRGMLKNYAGFLGLDPEPLLLRFAEGLQARLALKQQAVRPQTRAAEARPVEPGPKGRAQPRAQSRASSPLRAVFSREFLMVAVLVISLAGFVVWGALRIFSMRPGASGPSPTPRSIAEVILEPETVTPSPALESTQEDAEAVAFTPRPAGGEAGEEQLAETAGTLEGTAGEAGAQDTGAPGGAAGVQVYINVQQRTWLRVLVDGKVQQEGRVGPDSAFEFSGENQVEVMTGNGAALEIFFNGQDQGRLGEFGQVVNLIYTADGVMTPTPTITPTPTTTARPSPTPRGTPAAPAPTRTP